MTTALIGIVAFVVVALVGWAVAEGKAKAVNYEASDNELQSLQTWTDALNQRERELDINDVMSTISTKGFKAV